MKYKNNRIIVLVLVCLLMKTMVCLSHNEITLQCNLIASGDSVIKYIVEYVDPGEEGENSVWDFCYLHTLGSYYTKFDTLEHNRLVGYDLQNTYNYIVDKGNLMLSSIESPLNSTVFQQPQLVLPMPLRYNEEMETEYSSEGRYCGTHFERTFGHVKVNADGYGTIILSENDTLPNTLRVYTVNVAAIRLSKDSCRNDSDNLKQVITERYQWFSRGYRYPVLETITSSTYDNMNHVATQQYAYSCPPFLQRELSDSINKQIRGNESLNNQNNHGVKNDDIWNDNHNRQNFDYEIQTNGSMITIIYDIKKHSHVHAMVVDVLGAIHRDIQQTNEAGTGYTMSIDCSGLRRGQYIIYINVNGTIYNCKIPIK